MAGHRLLPSCWRLRYICLIVSHRQLASGCTLLPSFWMESIAINHCLTGGDRELLIVEHRLQYAWLQTYLYYIMHIGSHTQHSRPRLYTPAALHTHVGCMHELGYLCSRQSQYSLTMAIPSHAPHHAQDTPSELSEWPTQPYPTSCSKRPDWLFSLLSQDWENCTSTLSTNKYP